MRYESIDNIVFDNPHDGEVNIKDIREYPDYQTFISLNIKDGDKIDEIASRSGVYGDDTEGDSYKIVDNNIVKLFDAKFDLSKITKLEIPL